MINEKEKKIIEKYCKLPAIGSTAFIMSFVIGGVWLVLVIISALVFKDGKFENIAIGMYTYFIFMAIYIAIFAYSYLRTHLGMRGKQWKDIVDKVSAAQTNKNYTAQMAGTIGLSTVGRILKGSKNEITKNIGQTAEIAGAIGQVATMTAIGNQMYNNAKKVAKASKIKIPKATGNIFLLIVLPILILIATYIPGYIKAHEKLQNEKIIVSETVYKLRDAFEKECERVSIDDPYEKYEEHGYSVIAYIDRSQKENYLYITVGNDGIIEDVNYYGFVDVQKSKEENIENVEKIYSKFHKLLVDSGVSLSSDMIERYTLSDEFKEKFRNGSYEEEVFASENSIYFSYTTKFGGPEISMRIKVKD